MKDRVKIDIVCFSDIRWDFVRQRHQHIFTRFPKSWNILFIEPTSLIVLLKQPSRFFLRKADNITIASMPSLPLIDHLGYLRPLNDLLIRNWLHFLLLRLHIKKPVLWYYEPRYSSLIGKLDERMVVYDCADDRMAFAGVPPWIKEYMEQLIKKAQVIFATSNNLYNKMRQYGKDNVYLVGNGVDVDHFKKAMSDIPIPEEIKTLQKPIIGYFGVIDQWLDLTLIKEIALAYPNSSILLIGPIMLKLGEEFDELKKCQNVFLIGKRPYELLPNYLKAFDVCIIPFKITELTKSVNPVKLYEYLAGGKNVVSTALPELEKYGDIIYIAEDRVKFIRKIDQALIHSLDMDKIQPLLLTHTWDCNAKLMETAMLENLPD